MLRLLFCSAITLELPIYQPTQSITPKKTYGHRFSLYEKNKFTHCTLQVLFCSSKDQIVDVLTKPLVSNKFTNFRSSLNVVDTPLDSRDCIIISQPMGHFDKQKVSTIHANTATKSLEDHTRNT